MTHSLSETRKAVRLPTAESVSGFIVERIIASMGKNTIVRHLNNRNYIKRNRENMIAYLRDLACCDCGESDIRVLEFDHVRGTKLLDVSVMVARGYGWRRIESEIEKCVVRCANCHRRKTVLDRGWYKGIVDGM